MPANPGANGFPRGSFDPHLPKSFQEVTVGAAAVALTVPTGATRADIQVQAQPLRYRVDGTNPTSTVGFAAAADEWVVLQGEELGLARFIRSGGSDALLAVQWYAAS